MIAGLYAFAIGNESLNAQELCKLLSGGLAKNWVKNVGVEYVREYIDEVVENHAEVYPPKNKHNHIMYAMRLIADARDPAIPALADETLEIVYSELYDMMSPNNKDLHFKSQTQKEKYELALRHWDELAGARTPSH